MAFVRKKKVGGREYYQLVENYREGGKVRQRVLTHLGREPTVDAAIEWWEGRLERCHEGVDKYEAKANKIQADYRSRHYARGDEPPRLKHRRFSHPYNQYWFSREQVEKNRKGMAKAEQKLTELRELKAQGKAPDDPPEVKEQRERERQEASKSLNALHARMQALMSRQTSSSA